MSFEDFILSPDTVPLNVKNGTLTGDSFRRDHGIVQGTVLSGDYHVDYVDRGHLQDIIADAGESIFSMIPIPMGLLDYRALEASGILRAQQHPYLDLRGQGTLIGFIDTGIDYTNECFIYDDGTSKIKYIWDQSKPSAEGEKYPQDFFFGTEYSNDDINTALSSENPKNIVPHTDDEGHGTFLASVAAGRKGKEFSGAAPDAEIICVKLKKAPPFVRENFLIPDYQKNVYSSSDLMLGIQYIINKSREIGRPAAICIALGSHAGGHDGLSLIEEYLTRISSVTGIAVVCAAGNEAQARHHISGKITRAGELQIIELLSDNQNGENDIYAILVNGYSDRLAVSVTSPSGEVIPRIPVRSGTSYSVNLLMEKSRVTVEYYLPLRSSGDQYSIVKIFHPTSGIWKITVHGEIILDGTYHIWLPLTGLTSPHASFLASSPAYTAVIPATSPGVLSCGAYDVRNNSIYSLSSWGPTRRSSTYPDLTSPGVNIPGYYPNGVIGYMSGTSVAAAITTGACAQMLQWGIVDRNDSALSSVRIKANLKRGCSRDSWISYPNNHWGYGKLNLFNSIDIMRPI